VHRHLGRHLRQRLRQKVRRPHPHLQRAKRMLNPELPEDLQAALAAMIGDWAVHRTKPRHPVERHFSASDRKESETLEGVASILPHIVTNDDLLEKIWDKADAMDHGRDGHVPALDSIQFWRVIGRRESQKLVGRLRQSHCIRSGAEVWPAIHGLFAWINPQETSYQPIDAGLEDLVREVGLVSPRAEW